MNPLILSSTGSNEEGYHVMLEMGRSQEARQQPPPLFRKQYTCRLTPTRRHRAPTLSHQPLVYNTTSRPTSLPRSPNFGRSSKTYSTFRPHSKVSSINTAARASARYTVRHHHTQHTRCTSHLLQKSQLVTRVTTTVTRRKSNTTPSQPLLLVLLAMQSFENRRYRQDSQDDRRSDACARTLVQQHIVE